MLVICNKSLQFHEPWGQLMKTGYQNSRFAHQVKNVTFFGGLISLRKSWKQNDLIEWGFFWWTCVMQVERFACLYTSQVSNLGLFSPDKYYRPSEDFMQHEFGIVAYETPDI